MNKSIDNTVNYEISTNIINKIYELVDGNNIDNYLNGNVRNYDDIIEQIYGCNFVQLFLQIEKNRTIVLTNMYLLTKGYAEKNNCCDKFERKLNDDLIKFIINYNDVKDLMQYTAIADYVCVNNLDLRNEINENNDDDNNTSAVIDANADGITGKGNLHFNENLHPYWRHHKKLNNINITSEKKNIDEIITEYFNVFKPSIDYLDEYGNSYIYYCCKYDMVKFLLLFNNSQNFLSINNNSESCLMIAIARSNMSVLDIIVKKIQSKYANEIIEKYLNHRNIEGNNVYDLVYEDIRCLSILLKHFNKYSFNINYKSKYGDVLYTKYILETYNRDINVVKNILTNYDINPNATDMYGENILTKFLIKFLNNETDEFIDVIRELLR